MAIAVMTCFCFHLVIVLKIVLMLCQRKKNVLLQYIRKFVDTIIPTTSNYNIPVVEAACTLPVDLQSSSWTYTDQFQSSPLPLIFTSNTMKGFKLNGEGTPLQDYTCISSNENDIYIFKADLLFTSRGNVMRVYICMKLKKLSDSVYYAYFLSNKGGSLIRPAGERVEVKPTPYPSDNDPTCDFCDVNSVPDDDEVKKFQKLGSSAPIPPIPSVCPYCDSNCIAVGICDVNPCMNNGTCNDLTSDYNCTCAAGWEGENCTTGLLTVAIAPANQMVIQGNSQTITCIITGTPAVQSVEWRKNSQTVTVDGSKYTSGGTTSIPTLTITNFQSSDAATYTCRATHAAGTRESTNSVLTYSTYPSIVVSPTSGNVNIGTSTYTITCTVTATPEATTWSWTKTTTGGQSTTINQRINDGKYSVANSASSPSLTINNIQTSDQAYYVCLATNVAGTRSSGPSELTITEDADTVNNNESLTDSCNVVKNVLIGIVVVLVIILIVHIVVDYWMYRKGYLQCKKKTDYADMQYYIDKHRYNEMSHRTADDNTSHIYNVVF